MCSIHVVYDALYLQLPPMCMQWKALTRKGLDSSPSTMSLIWTGFFFQLTGGIIFMLGFLFHSSTQISRGDCSLLTGFQSFPLTVLNGLISFQWPLFANYDGSLEIRPLCYWGYLYLGNKGEPLIQVKIPSDFFILGQGWQLPSKHRLNSVFSKWRSAGDIITISPDKSVQ